MLNEKVCLFRGVEDNSVETVVSLGSVLDGIKNGKWKTEIEYMRKLNIEQGKKACDPIKKTLTAFTMSGTFSEKRASDNLKNHSGLVQIDIDDCEDIETVRRALQADRHIAFVFLSPRGTGIKAGLRIQKNCDQAEAHTQAKAYFGINGWDSAVKDPARICFVSYDENLYINENAEEFRVIEKKTLPKKNIAKLKYIEDDLRRKWANELFDTAYKMISESGEGEKHFQRVKAGNLLGGGVAHGLFSESEVLGEMERVVSGYTRLPLEKAMKDIRDGMVNGQKLPLTPPKYISDRDKVQQKVVTEYKEKTGKEASYDDIVGGETDVLLKDMYFKILGHMGGYYYIMPVETGTVLKFASLSKNELLKIAPLYHWQAIYGKDNGSVDWDSATSDCYTEANKVGFFDMHKVRGRGVWLDNGNVVVNLGNRVIGSTTNDYIYSKGMSISVPTETPATLEEARVFAKMLEYLPMSTSEDMMTFGGWLATAPICGALVWRPQLWITAQRGTGKSTIKNKIMMPMLGSLAIYPTGDATTEAGIRQTLKGDALAVIHEEAEATSDIGKRTMQNKLLLARASSSDDCASVMKGSQDGNAMHYSVKSSFCFISIGVPTMSGADDSRFSIVTLQPRERIRNADERYLKLLEYIDMIDFDKMRARSISMVNIIRDSAVVFQKVVTEAVKNARTGDQLSGILAGYYSLVSDNVVTCETAKSMVDSMDLSSYLEKMEEDQTDHFNCLRTILGCIPPNCTLSIGEMIDGASSGDSENMARLRRYGITVFDEKELWFANKNTQLEILLKDTPYQKTYISELKRIDGYQSCRKTVKVNSVACKGFTLPMSIFEDKKVEISQGNLF